MTPARQLSRYCGYMLALSAVLALLATCHAATSAAAEPGQPMAAKSLPASIAALVRQLDDDQFSRREEASSRLEEAGVTAIEGLRRAAVGESLEASTRAFAILKKFLTGNNPAASAAAREALQGIAAERDAAAKKGNDSLVAAAVRARGILDQLANATELPVYPSMIRPNFGGPGVPIRAFGMLGGIRIAGGQINVIQGGGISSTSITTKVVNGTRHVEVEETKGEGQKRSVKIDSDPQAGITMDVVTTTNGKQQTEKFQARDADALKKEHPDAFKLYQQFGGDGAGGVRIGGQLQIQGGRIAVGVAPDAAGGQIGAQLDELRKAVREMQKLNRPVEPEATRQRIEESKQQLENLRRQQQRDRAVPAEK